MTDRATELRAMARAATPGPWNYADNWSADGQEYFGCGVLFKGIERVWLEDSPETDIPTARLIAQAPTIALELADALDLLAKKDEELAADAVSLSTAEAQVDRMREALELCARLGSETVQRIARAALTPAPHDLPSRGERGRWCDMTREQIVAGLARPLGPWSEGRHYGTTGRTIQTIGIFGKVDVTTGWENGKASAHRTYAETTWHDDETAAIAFLDADYRARIAAALDADKIVALVEAANYAEIMCRLDYHKQIDKESDHFSQAVHDTWQRLVAALAAFQGDPT